MAYSDKVIEHYEKPRNVGTLDKEDPTVGTGLVGAPACGDVMRLQIKVDPETGIVEDAKFKTFGCGSAIASSSLVTEWVQDARRPHPDHVLRHRRGAQPAAGEVPRLGGGGGRAVERDRRLPQEAGGAQAGGRSWRSQGRGRRRKQRCR